METKFSQPGFEPAVPSVTESHSVSAFTARNSTAKSQHGISSTVFVQSEAGNFRFLSLPLEIRQQIYRLYFISTRNKYRSSYRLLETDKNCNIYCLTQCRTQILTVNRQLHSEARDVLYSDTTWHISFNSLSGKPEPEIASNASLQAFRSRPEFHLIQNITVGVMFHLTAGFHPSEDPSDDLSAWTPEDSIRLEINRKLLNFICETLLQAPNLLSLKLLWHDVIEFGHFKEKRDCLTALARLPETVKCSVFLAAEASTVHFHQVRDPNLKSPWAQDYAAKTYLNRFLKTVREQHQASSQRDEAPEVPP